MADDEKPWRRLARAPPEQVRSPEEPAPLSPSELQAQEWLRKVGLVSGAAIIFSVYHWNSRGKHEYNVFVPPRAKTLPLEVVEGWKRSMRFKEGVRVIGRQSLIATGVAALYFGVELGVSKLRDGVQDAWNTATAGVTAGGYLGVNVPKQRIRLGVLGAVGGGLLAGASGAAQQWLLQQQQHLQPQPQQQQQQQQGAQQPLNTSHHSSSSSSRSGVR